MCLVRTAILKGAFKMANKKYVVPLNSEIYNMPYYCACCLNATNGRFSVSVPRNENIGLVKCTVDFPLCDECKKHISPKNYNEELWLALLLAAIVEAGILMSFGFFCEIINTAIFGFLAGFFVFLIFLFARRIPALNSPHTSRNSFVEIVHFKNAAKIKSLGIVPQNDNGMAFIFSNKEFARIFKEINGENAGEIITIKGNNELEGTDLFNSLDNASYWVMLSLFISACMAFAFVYIVENFL